jgi:cytochrome b561
MPFRNTNATYGSVARFLHWCIFVLITSMLTAGFIMINMENSPGKFQLYALHKSFGILILFLAAVRLWWKFHNLSPELPDSLDIWQKRAAKANHIILYILMFAMPLSGWAMSSAAGFPVSVFGWFILPSLIPANKELLEFFREAHLIIAYLIIIMVLFHATAAFLHHFYYKDNVLKRMLFFSKENLHE